MQNQTVVVEESFVDNFDLGMLDDLDNLFIDDVDDQHVIEDEDLLASALNGVEDDEELAAMYASQEVHIDPVVEVPEVVSVAGEEQEILPVAVSATLGAVAAVKAHKSRATSTSLRILSKLGAESVDYTTLTPADAAKSDEEIVEDFSRTVDAMAMYVSDKAVNLFTFLKVGGGLNEVTRRGFEVLLKDECITGGDKGNLVVNLLSKPYSLGTAKSQSNQIIQLFTDLKIGTRSGRGAVMINQESVILHRVKTIMGK